MKTSIKLFLLSVVFVFASCKDNNKQNPTETNQEMISVTHQLGTVEVPLNPKRVVVLDFGILENLDFIDANVVGIPKTGLPDYLSDYKNDESVANLGTLVEVNLESINELQPDLIILGGRLAESYESISKIAPTILPANRTGDQLGELKENLGLLGKIFDEEAKFEEAFAKIEEKVAVVKAKTKTLDDKALVVLHNKGRFSAYGSGSRFGIVHDDMGLEEAAEGLGTHRHGNRVSSEFIQKTNPDILFIVDRSAAIGDQPLDRNEVENELIQRTNAYKNGKIVYLNPAAWYLSGGGGIYSMNIMIDEVGGVF